MNAKLSAHFIGAQIQVIYDQPPALEKRPGAPNGFVWEARAYRMTAILKEWHDYKLHGKSEIFYAKEQGSYRAKAADRQGTWGTGRDYYRVRTDTGEVFDIYYDRTPGGPGGRKGNWFLYQQVAEDNVQSESP
jgi:hypothetical protein